jgi:6-pyruvoyltetrahydropterin/6-carboxytetrahydropterin synthase
MHEVQRFRWLGERRPSFLSPPQTVRLTRAIEFSSSLRYACPDLSESENQARFGPAARQHGHNYRLEVTLEGRPDPVTGMVIDLKELKQILEREIVARFDHRDLNRDTPYFEKVPPTPENLARLVFELLREVLGDRLFAVRLRQDEDLWADVRAVR